MVKDKFYNSMNIKVINSIGQVLQTHKYNQQNQSATLNVSGFNSGFYLIDINIDGIHVTKKLIIK